MDICHSHGCQGMPTGAEERDGEARGWRNRPWALGRGGVTEGVDTLEARRAGQRARGGLW